MFNERIKEGKNLTRMNKAEIKDCLHKMGIHTGQHDQTKDYYIKLYNKVTSERPYLLHKIQNEDTEVLNKKRKRTIDLSGTSDIEQHLTNEEESQQILEEKDKGNHLEEEQLEQDVIDTNGIKRSLNYNKLLSIIKNSLDEPKYKTDEFVNGVGCDDEEEKNIGNSNNVGSFQQTFTEDNQPRPRSWTFDKVPSVSEKQNEEEIEQEIPKESNIPETFEYEVVSSSDDSDIDLVEKKKEQTSANAPYGSVLNVKTMRIEFKPVLKSNSNNLIINSEVIEVKESEDRSSRRMSNLNSNRQVSGTDIRRSSVDLLCSRRRLSSNKQLSVEIRDPTVSDFTNDKTHWQRIEKFIEEKYRLNYDNILILMSSGIFLICDWVFISYCFDNPNNKRLILCVIIVAIVIYIIKTISMQRTIAENDFQLLKRLISNTPIENPENFLGIFENSFIKDVAEMNQMSVESYKTNIMPRINELISKDEQIISTEVIISEQPHLVWKFRE